MGTTSPVRCQKRGAALAVALLAALPLRAHEMSPAIADLVLADRGDSTLVVTLNLEAVLAGLGPDHDSSESGALSEAYAALRALSPDALAERLQAETPGPVTLRAAGAPVILGEPRIDVPPLPEADLPRESTLRYAFALPRGTKTLKWEFAPRYAPSVIRVTMPGAAEPGFAELVSPGETAAITLDRPLSGGAPLWTWALAAGAVVALAGALWLRRRGRKRA